LGTVGSDSYLVASIVTFLLHFILFDRLRSFLSDLDLGATS